MTKRYRQFWALTPDERKRLLREQPDYWKWIQ